MGCLYCKNRHDNVHWDFSNMERDFRDVPGKSKLKNLKCHVILKKIKV